MRVTKDAIIAGKIYITHWRNNKLEINIEKLVWRQFVLSVNFVSKALYSILALNNFCKKSLGKMFEYDFVLTKYLKKNKIGVTDCQNLVYLFCYYGFTVKQFYSYVLMFYSIQGTIQKDVCSGYIYSVYKNICLYLKHIGSIFTGQKRILGKTLLFHWVIKDTLYMYVLN